MSDSDDTDILLLIPPDFFLAENSFRENSGGDLLMSFSSIDFSSTAKPINSFRSYSNCSSQNNQLLIIDRKISDLERESASCQNKLLASNEEGEGCKNQLCNCTANNSFDTTIYCKMNGSSPRKQLNYSTPKQQQNGEIRNHKLSLDFGVTPRENDKFLKEIDYFLDDSNTHTSVSHNMMVRPTQQSNNVHSLAVETLKRHNSMLQDENNRNEKEYHQTIGNNYNLPRNSMKETNGQQYNREEPPLISLSQLWGADGNAETSTMQEERLRRQHCEREIQALQTRLLEYQQKISVAMKIDNSKDEAIGRLQKTNSR